MAQVPRTEPSVSQSTQPLPSGTDPAAFGASVVGAGLSGLGKEVGNISDTLANHALTMAQQDNELLVNNQRLVYDQKANELQTNFFDLKGAAAAAALPGAYKALGDARTEMLSSLPNNNARAMFASASANSQQFFMSQFAAHAGQERREAILNSAVAVQKTTFDQTVKSYGSPAFEPSMFGLFQQTYKVNELHGGDENTLKLAWANAKSDVIKGVIVNQVQTDPLKAEATLASHKDDLTYDDYNALNKLVDAGVVPIKASQDAQEAISSAAAPAGSTPNRGAPQGSIDANITSAIGPHATTSGDRTVEHNREVGGVPNSLHLQPGHARDITPRGFSIQSSQGQAWAAESASKLRSAGYHVINEGDHLHVDTASHGGVPLNSAAEIEANAPTVLARARAIAMQRPEYANDPTYADKVEQTTWARMQRLKGQYDAQDYAAQGVLIESLNGGADGSGHQPTTLNELMQYPGAKAAWTQIQSDPRKVTATLDALDRNANPSPRNATPEQWTRYRELIGMAANPFGTSEFQRQNLLVENLPQQWITSLYRTQQTAIATGKGIANPNIMAAMKQAQAYLSQAGIKASDSESSDYNHFRGALTNSLESFFTIYGRSPHQQELEKMIQAEFVTGAKNGENYFGFNTPTTEGYHIGVVAHVPNEEAVRIAHNLRSIGLPVSADTIRQAFAAEHRNAR